MRLFWTANGIPHGFLCDTPIHLIYRLRGCAPVGELKIIFDNLKLEVKDLRRQQPKSTKELQALLAEQMEVYDELLDAQDQSKFILQDEAVARIVIDSWLTLRDRQLCRVYVICVMGNHVHVLLAGLPNAQDMLLGLVLRKHKSFTDRTIKGLLHRGEDVWDTGYFDRYVRAGTFWEILLYILDNPRKAGLVSEWRQWPNTWVDERCLAAAKTHGFTL